VLVSRHASRGPSGPPVHIDSSPAGAQVRIDGAGYGNTPLDVRLEPGQHTLDLHHPEALDDHHSLQVAATGARVEVRMWRRRPAAVAVRPVYPGAALLDAQFLNDGQVALVVGLPTQAGAPTASRELWRLDPATGQLARVGIPWPVSAATSMVMAPGGDQVALVTPASSPPVTTAGWRTDTASPEVSRPETVWVAALDGDRPPRSVFELPSVSTPTTLAPTADPERIASLVWTPDGARLVAITRQSGPPARARVLLLNVRAPGDTDTPPVAADELVLLPAEVLPNSATPDPNGQWLAMVTHAASAPGGNDLLNLCALELRAGGSFRDLADLGSVGSAAAAAPIAWSPASDSKSQRLLFVGPAPAAASSGGGLFGFGAIFAALRPSAPPSGLFIADVDASGLADAQPRRLGSVLNTFGPLWRSQTSLFAFVREGDGTLGLRSVDPTSGAVHDLGVQLPATTAQGAGVAARWDARHGRALLLTRSPNSTAAGTSLQAWLVSFVSPSSQSDVTR